MATIRRSFPSILMVVVCLTLLRVPVSAETRTVVVLPFEINAAQDLAYLREEIPKIIGQHFAQEGARIVSPPARYLQTAGLPSIGREEARQAGVETGADAVVWGSMTLVGQQFSLDAELLEVFDVGAPRRFAVTGQGLETLPLKVKELATEIRLVLFKQQKIIAIRVEGNQRIEVDAIRKVIRSAAGDVYSVKNLSDDLKNVFAMGYFDDVRVEAEEGLQGREVIFKVKEKPTIRYIRFEGNRIFDDKELQENTTLKTGAILNIFTIQNNIQRIEELYREKNYQNIRVNYRIEDQPNNQADLEFVIEEGERLKIKHIFFEGNKDFTAKELKKAIETSEEGFLSFITGSGELKKDDLQQDVGRLEGFYNNQGYIRARVGEPQVVYLENAIEITFKIEEGPRYKVGTVDIAGDLIFPKEVLMEKIKLNEEEYYNRMVLSNDLIALGDLYADEGYANNDISPRVDENNEERVVNIVYQISKGKQVYFEEIVISGNTKTRDKVIRRQLEIYEQGLFSSSRLKRSVRNLHRLDYFQDVKVNTLPGSADDKMILKVDVEEKSTGQFSIGGGYSNVQKFFAVGSVSQRNLFGRGQILNLKGELGQVTQRYTVSFTEPWLFDIPLSAGVRVYNWITQFRAYDKDSIGGGVSFGYPVYTDTRFTVGFNYDLANINNIDEDRVPDSITDLIDRTGKSDITTLSTEASLRYDTRDRIFSPDRGADHRISLEYAGFGGDIGFTKTVAQVAWYHPLFKQFVGYWRVKGGYARENQDGVLPDYERFFLGGIDSIRGFSGSEINPEDKDGNEIGGDKYVFTNVEVSYPVIKDLGVDVYVFFDMGANVDGQAKDPDQRSLEWAAMRKSSGLGIRWNSPMGPLEMAYGWKLDKKNGEEPGNWEFSMGGAF